MGQLSIIEIEKIKEGISTISVDELTNTDKRFSVVSLFSGCGGMDLGFKGGFSVFGKEYEENPYEIIFANDIIEEACKTYKHNLGHEVICQDIREIDLEQIPKSDIVIGGFPCQDFSLAGKRKGLGTERGRLYQEMKKVITHCQPLAFVAENVDGIRRNKYGKDTSALDIIMKEFQEIGYRVIYKVLNAADYGIPQNRIRIIIIGIHSNLNKTILYPKRLRGDFTGVPWMTSKEAIDDLWEKLDINGISNHTKKDYSKAKFYPGKKMQGNCQISADKPAPTIRAEHHGNIEGHYRSTNPDEPENTQYWRRLTVRECARLQSFPDNFVFPCSPSYAYKLIGNAVPPVLSWNIARALHKSITNP